jgi:hypothetical protein
MRVRSVFEVSTPYCPLQKTNLLLQRTKIHLPVAELQYFQEIRLTDLTMRSAKVYGFLLVLFFTIHSVLSSLSEDGNTISSERASQSNTQPEKPMFNSSGNSRFGRSIKFSIVYRFFNWEEKTT